MDGLQPELAAQLPTLRRIRDALYSPRFRAFVEQVRICWSGVLFCHCNDREHACALNLAPARCRACTKGRWAPASAAAIAGAVLLDFCSAACLYRSARYVSGTMHTKLPRSCTAIMRYQCWCKPPMTHANIMHQLVAVCLALDVLKQKHLQTFMRACADYRFGGRHADRRNRLQQQLLRHRRPPPLPR